MKTIARAINGISINGLEYLLQPNDDLMLFKTEESAVEFLLNNGLNPEDYTIEDHKEKTLQEQVDELLCNAFIGVCHPINKHSELAWHVEENEERMRPIDELIDELKNTEDSDDFIKLRSLAKKGITEVVLIRGW